MIPSENFILPRREKRELNFYKLFWKKSFLSLCFSFYLSLYLWNFNQNPYPEMESKECLYVEKKIQALENVLNNLELTFYEPPPPKKKNYHNYRYFLIDGDLSSLSSFKTSFLLGPNTIRIIQKYCLHIYCYNRTQHI